VDLRRKLIDLSRPKQNRNHQIVIGPPLAAVLKEALAEAADGFVFLSGRGKPYTVDGFSKHFAKVAARAGVPDITFHDLRRHVGTLLINAGERLDVVSKLLGHSTVAVTQRSYPHLATEATRGAFATLASFAPALPPAKQRKSHNSQKQASA
jgi:integrase